MRRATVVSCAPDASVAERYAVTCAAFAVAEAAREKGEDVLLVLDDFTGLVGFPGEMARLSPQLEMEDATEEEMVEHEGMIINALLAERRRFLGMTLQRVARERRTRRGEPHAPRGDVPRARRVQGKTRRREEQARLAKPRAAARRRGFPRGSTT